eukprot:TRINITY_DN68051_c0_g1_i1.p1 TRINITY_DN68051_c0_g1~~TRINITY_DN68051_c0_g1_i1.p1  ORF type:complete len:1338 (+),score=245.02 TRINITY_DN68051_c0_g1_i1:577-4014(+)
MPTVLDAPRPSNGSPRDRQDDSEVRLLLIRHAESESKVRRRQNLPKLPDPGLSENGYIQAEALGSRLASEFKSARNGNFIVASSPMRRCLLTIRPAVHRLGLTTDKCICHGACYEYGCAGLEWRGTVADEIQEEFPEFQLVSFNGDGSWHYRGKSHKENETEARLRAATIVDWIRKTALHMRGSTDAGTIMFCTHQTIADLLCNLLLDGTCKNWNYGDIDYRLADAALTEVFLSADGSARVGNQNDFSHTKDLGQSDYASVGHTKTIVSLRAGFAQLDKSGNRKLDFEDLTELLGRGEEKMSESMLRTLFKHMDHDNDGEVAFDEFVDFVFSDQDGLGEALITKLTTMHASRKTKASRAGRPVSPSIAVINEGKRLETPNMAVPAWQRGRSSSPCNVELDLSIASTLSAGISLGDPPSPSCSPARPQFPMLPVRLLLICHADAALRDGTSERGLSERGYEEAEALGYRLGDEFKQSRPHAVVIGTCPLRTCMLTIRPAVHRLGLTSDDCICHGGCYEVGAAGRSFPGTAASTIANLFPEFQLVGFGDDGYWDYRGSSNKETDEEARVRGGRIVAWIWGMAGTLRQQAPQGKGTLLLCISKHVGDLICHHLIDQKTAEWTSSMSKYRMNSSSITEIMLEADGTAQMGRANDTEHVRTIETPNTRMTNLRKRTKSSEVADLRGQFARCDKEGDRRLDASELCELLRAGQDGLSDQECQELFKVIDTDGDDYIDFEELLNHLYPDSTEAESQSLAALFDKRRSTTDPADPSRVGGRATVAPTSESTASQPREATSPHSAHVPASWQASLSAPMQTKSKRRAPVRLLLVRHAQSGNKERDANGKKITSKDPCLSEKGYEQAEALGHRLSREFGQRQGRDLVIASSPMRRCLLTIRPAVHRLALATADCICHGGSYEYGCAGNLFRGTSASSIADDFPEFQLVGFDDEGFWDYRGDSDKEVEAEARLRGRRVAAWLRDAIQAVRMQASSGGTLIFCAHQTLADLLCHLLLRGTDKGWAYGDITYRMQNTALSELVMEADGRARMNRENDFQHIKGLLNSGPHPAFPGSACGRTRQIVDLRSKFAKFDRSGDRKLDFKELASLLGRGKVKVSDDEVRELHATMDTDGDGEVDFDDFVEYIFSSPTGKAMLL